MSMPVMKRRPMMDLAEIEGPLRRPRSANRWDNEPIAELARLLGRQDDLGKSGLQTDDVGQMNGRLISGSESSERKEPPPLERFITGDFAAIEAGLLGLGRQSRARPARAEAPALRREGPVLPERVVSDDFVEIKAGTDSVGRRPEPPISSQVEDIRAERTEPAAPAAFGAFDFAAIEAELLGARRQKLDAMPKEAGAPALPSGVTLHPDDEPEAALSRHIGIADDDIRSRLPIYAIAAIIVAGLVGIGASLGSRSGQTGLPETASSGPAMEAAAQAGPQSGVNGSGFGDSRQEASAFTDNLGQAKESSVAQEQAPAQDKTPRVISLSEPAQSEAGVETEAAIAATPQVQAQERLQEQARALADQGPSAAAFAPAQAPVAAVRPDDAPLAAAVPEQAATGAAPTPRAVASAPRSQAQKPAAHAAAASGHGHSGQNANVAKATPAASVAKPASAKSAAAKSALAKPALAKPTSAKPASANVAAAPVAPPASPAPAPAAGPFGFAQTAVSSITTGAAKLFDWGH